MQNNDSIKMVILDDYQNFFEKMKNDNRLLSIIDLSIFKNHFENPSDLINKIKDFHIVVGIRERTRFPEAVITKLLNLRLLITTGARNASFDLESATKNNIVVSGTPGAGEGPVDLTWGLIISLVRGIHTENSLIRKGKWGTMVGPSLTGKTLGLLGLGHIGKLVGKIGLAFGMNVISWSENLTKEIAAEYGVTYVDKETLCRQSDVLSIHTKLSDRTRGLIGSHEISLMKPTSYIINTSRGPIIEETALINALYSKKIAGAGLDTFDIEPLPKNHPFLFSPNTLITPHIGYITKESYEAYYDGIIENVITFLNNSPVRVLNPDVLNKIYT